MDFLQLLLLQFIAHILTDYTFQTDEKAKNKNELGFKSPFLKWHILVAFITSCVLSFQVNFIPYAVVIAITHWIIDGFKPVFSKNKYFAKYGFFIDQFLHLLMIVLVICFYVFENKIIINNLGFQLNTQYLAIILAYLICVKPTNIIIKEVFHVFDITFKQNGDELVNAGKLIGLIERWLVLTFVLVNHLDAVGFLLAAKSILRYKDDNTLKTEYVLIGTMLSFGIALFLGIVINMFFININNA